jgi:peptide/nickel transport system substrate-binding protein
VAAGCGGDDGESASSEPNGEATGGTDGGGEITITIPTEPSTLDPQAVNDRASRVVTVNVFDSLLFRNAEGEVVPSLATSVEQVDDSTWEVKLRDDVTFHNGDTFDAEDAAASINRIIDPDYETQRGSYTELITGAEVVDPTTIHITTDGIDAVLPTQLVNIPMVPANADEIDIGQKPVGTGPYEFVSWNKGRDIVLTRSDDYWGEAPSISDVVVRIIPDAQTAVAALQAGEVDVVLDLLPEQAELVPKFESFPGVEFSYVAFNAKRPELSDPRVRIAMNHAIDKQTLAETIYLGHAVPNDAQHLTPAMLGYNPDVDTYEYDPDKARQLLAEAGYPDGFEVTINVPIGRYLKGEESADYIAAQLEEIGLDVEVRKWEWNEYRDAGRIPGDEPGAFDLKYGWNDNAWFDASRIVNHITCDGSSSKLCDPEIDRIWTDALATTDQEERDRLYQEGWARLHENPHAIYLLQQNLIYGMSERVVWEPMRQDDEVIVANMRLVES